MITLKFREKEIIRLLLSQKCISGITLATDLNVSTRTIRNDVAKINSLLTQYNITINSCKSGYSLSYDNESKSFLISKLEEINSNDFGDPKNRESLIMSILLEDNSIDIYKLSEELYVSDSTIISDIRKINSDISDFDKTFNIQISKNTISIEHETEERIRKIFAGLLTGFFCESSILNEKFKEKELPIRTIYDSLVTNLVKQNLNLSQNDFYYLAQYLCLSLYRKKYTDKLVLTPKEIVNSDFCQNLNYSLKKFNFDLSDIEISIIDALLSSFNQLDKSEVISNIEDIIYPIISEIDALFASEFTKDKNLISNLQSHLLSMIKKQILLIPSLIDVDDSLENLYPFSHSIAKYFVSKLNKNQVFKDISFTDSETMLITIYFELSIERAKQDAEVRVVIVSDRGPASTKLLETQLNSKFPNFQILMSLSPMTFERIELQDTDLVISTISIPTLNKQPHIITIDFPFASNDLSNITAFVESNYFWRKTVYEDIILLPSEIKKHDEVIKYLNTYIQKIENKVLDIEKPLLDRENILSTFIGNKISMPHGLINNNLKFNLYIMKSIVGIDWMGDKVNWVICILINSKSRQNLNNYMRFVNYAYQLNEQLSLDYESFSEIYK